jgi:Cu-Zn family superoxide dismutase
MRRFLLVVGAMVISGAGVAGAKSVKQAAGKSVVVKLEPKSGSQASGTATFSEDKGQVKLVVELTGATPGEHALHIHEKGDCSDPEAKNAGGHWNPQTMAHGKWGTMPHHLGDIGNLTVGADGKGTLTMSTDKWSIGGGAPNDISGKAVVIHGGVDDFKTQPTGNAGNRIACGVIGGGAAANEPAKK